MTPIAIPATDMIPKHNRVEKRRPNLLYNTEYNINNIIILLSQAITLNS